MVPCIDQLDLFNAMFWKFDHSILAKLRNDLAIIVAKNVFVIKRIRFFLIDLNIGNPEVIIEIFQANDQLRSNATMATLVRERWLGSPGTGGLPSVLRIAALSGDAGCLERAIDDVTDCWRKGQLPSLGAPELRKLIDSEYWVLSDAARSSGQGHVLKQTLARLHRELAVQQESN